MIINADDFGYSQSVNRAVVQCFAEKRINRTTIMVNMPCAQEAAQLARENGFFDCVGLHINLTEGRALSEECAKSPLCDENGCFRGTFHIPFKSRLYLPKGIRHAIYCETKAQIKKFLDMGFTLMHADSHNYTHTYFSVYSQVRKLLAEYGFSSVRISRNVSEQKMSPAFSVYKKLINTAIKNQKTKNGKIRTTSYFGSVQDFVSQSVRDDIRTDIELMTHPDYIDGVLTDNTLPKPHPFVDSEWLRRNLLYPEDVSGKKIKLLVCFIQAHIGGAMTSLVNFLNALDTTKYDVDVMFYENDGRHGIKEDINILPQGKNHKSTSLSNVLKKSLSPLYLWAFVRDQYYKKVKKNKRKAVQIMSKEGCKYSRPLTKEYDIAIAYEYTWCLNYVTNRVKADKKILWHHGEYEKSGLDFRIDKKALDSADALVFVSEDCKKSYVQSHPEHGDKSYFIPNLLSSEYVRKRDDCTVSDIPFEDREGLIKFVTVARINFASKGLDRAVRVFAKLKQQNLTHNVRWVIIGKGSDMDELKALIAENDLGDVIYPIGVRKNPIPYLKHFDCFLLPSIYEGKPMVITESFIMGLVPVVTEYTSAREQIKDGVDGIIFPNSEQALFEGLRDLIANPQILQELRRNVASADYGNERDIAQFDELADKLM